MRNIWLNSIDKSLLYLGYSFNAIRMFDDKEKEAIIINEYLFRLKEDSEDISPLTVEEMADFIVYYQKA